MLGQPAYKLRSWIPAENWDIVQRRSVCENPHPSAILLWEKHWSEIRADHDALSNLLQNPAAGKFIESHWDDIMAEINTPDRVCETQHHCGCWHCLCSNPSTTHLLDQHWDAIWLRLDRYGLWENPNICSLLQKHWDCVLYTDVMWDSIGRNPSSDMIRLVEKYWNMSPTAKIELSILCGNPNPDAISLIDKHWGAGVRVSWYQLCANPSAIPLLDKHLYLAQNHMSADMWGELCGNPNAMHLVEQYWDVIRDKLDAGGWDYLCSNPSAGPFLEKHWDEILPNISWNALCCNSSADAAALVEKHWDFISNQPQFSWITILNLCYNYDHPLPLPISLIEKHWNEIVNSDANNWTSGILRSPDIFVLDLVAMRAQARPFAEELAAKVFHPRRVAAWEAAGIDVAQDL